MKQRSTVENLEGRVLFAANAWKSAVSGSWDTAANWSLGHVPTSSEDVQISFAGTYAVTLASGTTTASAKTLKVGGGSGTQTLVLNRKINTYGAVNVASGDVLTINSRGTLSNAATKVVTAQLDGTIKLAGTGNVVATLNWPSVNVNGSGKIVATTGGASAANALTAYGASVGPKITITGKKLAASSFTNHGLILADTVGETFTLFQVTNYGNIAAAPGKIKLTSFSPMPGSALTVGLGSTGSGQLNFDNSALNVELHGNFTVVTLGSYAPAVGAAITAATFARQPLARFDNRFLDSGNGRAYTLTETTTAITLKAKAGGTFASRSGSALTVTGSAYADAIGLVHESGLRYATLNGATSVFLDRLLSTVTVNAGGGNDYVVLADNPLITTLGVRINGQAGNDRLASDDGNDTLDGGAGNDSLYGGYGNDAYVFANANATAAETDIVREAQLAGTDTLDFSAMTDAVRANLIGMPPLAVMKNRTVVSESSADAINFENLTGGSGADVLIGSIYSNVLKGNGGHDTLDGGGAADSLYGGDGNDRLYGAGDLVKDLLDGGAGTDVKGSADAIDTLVSLP